MRQLRKLSTLAFFLAAAASPAVAQDEYVNPCDSAPFTDFDFWVGDWVAFDSNTRVVQGIDRIKKINDGCAIMQDWSQMTDRYRAQGSPDRYAGVSLNSVIQGGRWQQVWVV